MHSTLFLVRRYILTCLEDAATVPAQDIVCIKRAWWQGPDNLADLIHRKHEFNAPQNEAFILLRTNVLASVLNNILLS